MEKKDRSDRKTAQDRIQEGESLRARPPRQITSRFKEVRHTKCATWGFKEYSAKVIPIIKQTDAAMAELLYTRADGLGRDYLNISYTLDKSKIADALAKGVKWIKSLFQQTKDEEFFAKKIRDKTEEK